MAFLYLKNYLKNRKAAIIAVEFILIFPIIFVVLLALVDFARYFEYSRKAMYTASFSRNIIGNYSNFYDPSGSGLTTLELYYKDLAHLMLKPYSDSPQAKHCTILTILSRDASTPANRLDAVQVSTPSGCTGQLGNTKYPLITQNSKKYLVTYTDQDGDLFTNTGLSLLTVGSNQYVIIAEVRAKYPHFTYFSGFTEQNIVSNDIYKMSMGYSRVEMITVPQS